MGREGPDEQPVAVGGQLALVVVAIRGVEALIEHPGARHPAGRYAEARARWPAASDPDPRSVGPVGVPEPRDSLACAGIHRGQIGAGISPSSAVERLAALFAPHAPAEVASAALCAHFSLVRLAFVFKKTSPRCL